MGQVQQRLGNFLKPGCPHFIEQNCQNDGHRETEQQVEEIEPKRVSQGNSKVPHLKDELEVFQSNKLASLDALEDIVLLEDDNQASHWLIAENQIPQNRDCHHGI